MIDDSQKTIVKAMQAMAANAFEAAEILYGNQLYAESLILIQRYFDLQNQALLLLAEKASDGGTSASRARAVTEQYPDSPLTRGVDLEKVDTELSDLRNNLEEIQRNIRDNRPRISNVFRQAETYFSRCDRYVWSRTLTDRQVKLRRTLKRAVFAISAIGLLTYAGRLIYLQGYGITGSYYRGQAFQELAVTRKDRSIDFNFAGERPHGVPENDFSVRWEGQVYARTEGTYQFIVRVDDGARIKVDGETVINHWLPAPAADYTGSIDLTAGWHDLTVEYFQDRYSALIRLSWIPPGGEKAIIPQSSLRPR